MFKRIAPFLIALLCIVGFAPVAFAGGSGPQPAATVSGDSITLTVTGADPNTPVDFELYDDDQAPASMGMPGGGAGAAVLNLKLPFKLVAQKTVTADASGTAVAVFDGLPAGTYSAAARYLVDGVPTTQYFNNLSVQGSSGGAAADGGSLPNTGSDSSLPLARLGIVLVAAGGVAIFAGQKRRSMMRIDA